VTQLKMFQPAHTMWESAASRRRKGLAGKKKTVLVGRAQLGPIAAPLLSG